VGDARRWTGTDGYTDSQEGDFISLLLCFQNKESRLETNHPKLNLELGAYRFLLVLYSWLQTDSDLDLLCQRLTQQLLRHAFDLITDFRLSRWLILMLIPLWGLYTVWMWAVLPTFRRYIPHPSLEFKWLCWMSVRPKTKAVTSGPVAQGKRTGILNQNGPCEGHKETIGNWCSQAVSHPSTHKAYCCLTSFPVCWAGW
jgi:hypothetical protein